MIMGKCTLKAAQISNFNSRGISTESVEIQLFRFFVYGDISSNLYDHKIAAKTPIAIKALACSLFCCINCTCLKFNNFNSPRPKVNSGHTLMLAQTNLRIYRFNIFIPNSIVFP